MRPDNTRPGVGSRASAVVPPSVQSLVLGRADLLPPPEKRALQAASVLGQRGDYVGVRINPGLGHTWREARYELPYALAFASARLGPPPAVAPSHRKAY